MATKDRTESFLRFKDEYKNSRPYTSHKQASNVPLMHGENGIPLQTLGVAPQWIRLHDIEANLSRIQVKIEELSKCQSQNILNFDGESEDFKIDILSEEISKLLKQTHSLIETLGKDIPLKPEEVKIKKNIQSAMYTKIQTLSQIFRKKQRLYINSLHKNSTSLNWGTNNNNENTFDGEMGFTIDQLNTVIDIENTIKKRDRDIRKIVTSINELTGLLHDINLLVIDQGTILDNIEYNLDQTEINVDGGTVILKSIPSSRSRLCILLFLVILLLIIVISIIAKLT